MEAASSHVIDAATIYCGVPHTAVANFVLNFEPKVVAEHLTVIEEANLKKIDFRELVGQGWNKRDAEKRTPNLLAFIRHFNKITSWVTAEIILADKKSNRVLVIKHFIKIAQICYEMKNYNTVMEIISGLESPPISRLKRTWEEIGKLSTWLESLKEEFSVLSNYKKYRALLLKSLQSPLIPFFGVQLQDLTFIDEGNDDYANEEKQLINFDKIIMFSDTLSTFRKMQKKHYNIHITSPPLISSIFNCKTLNDKEAYDESLKLEPRK